MGSSKLADKPQALRFVLGAHSDSNSERIGAIGSAISLDYCWQQLQKQQNWHSQERQMIGEALLILLALSLALKDRGDLQLQLSSKHKLQKLYIQINSDFGINARIECESDEDNAEDYNLLELCNHDGETGVFSLFMLENDALKYQWHGAVEHAKLIDNLQSFLQLGSKQPANMEIQISSERASCLLLQASGTDEQQLEDFADANVLMQTLKPAELAKWSAAQILHKLFMQHPIEITQQATPYFYCGCTRDKAAQAILTLSKQDIEEILAEDAEIKISCANCGKSEYFDRIDISQIRNQIPASKALH